MHGFAQNGWCWAPVDADLAADHEIVAVDAPGHGEASDIDLDLRGCADAIVATGGRAVYLGYSMGARMCLHAALTAPESVSGLVLVSGTAGIDDADERAERRADDDELADSIERDPSEGGGVEAFLDEWLARPMFANLPDSARHIEARQMNTTSGLAASLRTAGTGTQDSLWSRLAGLEMPVLVVTGELDAKFTDLGQRMVAAIGANAALVTIPAAGHTVHLEAPDAFVAAVRRWLTDRD